MKGAGDEASVALAILVVGLVWAGVPASTLLIAGAVLVCPLMMMFMMRGGHGGHGGHGGDSAGQQPPQEHHREHQSTAGRDRDGVLR